MQHENMTVIVGYPDYTSYTSYTRYPRSMHAPKMSSHSNCRIDLSNEFRFFSLFYFSIWLRLPSNFFPHTFNSIKQISDRLIGSIGETTFLFCPKNWQKTTTKTKAQQERRKNNVETAENCGKSKQQSVKTNVQRFGVSSIHFWLVLNWS